VDIKFPREFRGKGGRGFSFAPSIIISLRLAGEQDVKAGQVHILKEQKKLEGSARSCHKLSQEKKKMWRSQGGWGVPTILGMSTGRCSEFPRAPVNAYLEQKQDEDGSGRGEKGLRDD